VCWNFGGLRKNSWRCVGGVCLRCRVSWEKEFYNIPALSVEPPSLAHAIAESAATLGVILGAEKIEINTIEFGTRRLPGKSVDLIKTHF
jgi:hypothetical protein